MKKVLKCMGMMALVALAFTSCKKNEETKRVFYASGVEGEIEFVDEDRAYSNPTSPTTTVFTFEQGDVTMVFNIDETTPTKSHAALYGTTTSGSTAVPFVNIGYGEIGEDMLDGYYAFYPGGVGHMITYLYNGENKCKFYVAPEQEYRPNMVPKKALYAAAKNNGGTHMMDNTNFDFTPICGTFQLKPFEAAQRTVTKIEIVDNAFCLSGLVELIIPEVDPVEMTALFNQYDLSNPAYVQRLNAYKQRVGYNVTDEEIFDQLTGETNHYIKGNRMTLNVPGGVKLGTNSANTPAFNIVLRPLALSQGFHIIFTFDNGDVKDIDLSHVNRIMVPNKTKVQPINLDNYPG